MSWLKPENIRPNDYDPQAVVAAMVERYGPASQIVLRAYNEIDPSHCFYGDNIDEYHGYAERFIQQLGDRELRSLSDAEMVEMVRSTFTEEQINRGFVQNSDIAAIAGKIVEIVSGS